MADIEILRAGDSGYDESRRVWNAMVDRRPALIARCREPRDVVVAIATARREGLEIGVRCGGHSVVGLAVPEGGLMIDLTPMGGVRVDVERRRAWVQGGALLGALDAATQPHGLARPRARPVLRQRALVRGGHRERRDRSRLSGGEH